MPLSYLTFLKVSENLGATAVALVASADRSLLICICIFYLSNPNRFGRVLNRLKLHNNWIVTVWPVKNQFWPKMHTESHIVYKWNNKVASKPIILMKLDSRIWKKTILIIHVLSKFILWEIWEKLKTGLFLGLSAYWGLIIIGTFIQFN